MSSIGNKLKEILSDRGLTATELSRIADVRVSFIYDVLSGKSKNPSIITLSRIANSLTIPLSELSGSEQAGLGTGASSKLSQGFMAIPALEGSESSHKEHYLFRRNWLKSGLDTEPSNLKLIQITGDSMEPILTHGDTLLIDTSKKNPSPPGIFAIDEGHGAVIKRIDVLSGSNPTILIIKSDNTQYASYERPMRDTQILGRVVWVAKYI